MVSTVSSLEVLQQIWMHSIIKLQYFKMSILRQLCNYCKGVVFIQLSAFISIQLSWKQRMHKTLNKKCSFKKKSNIPGNTWDGELWRNIFVSFVFRTRRIEAQKPTTWRMHFFNLHKITHHPKNFKSQNL